MAFNTTSIFDRPLTCPCIDIVVIGHPRYQKSMKCDQSLYEAESNVGL